MSSRGSNHSGDGHGPVDTLPCLGSASLINDPLHLPTYHLNFRVFDAFLLANHGRSVVSALAKVPDASK